MHIVPIPTPNIRFCSTARPGSLQPCHRSEDTVAQIRENGGHHLRRPPVAVPGTLLTTYIRHIGVSVITGVGNGHSMTEPSGVTLRYPNPDEKVQLLLTVGEDGHACAGMLEAPHAYIVSVSKSRQAFFQTRSSDLVGHCLIATPQYKFIRRSLNRRCVIQGPDVRDK